MRSIALVSTILTAAAVVDAGPSQYVNHFIGTTNGGHVFPGATLPWGSVKAGADCASNENQAGYVEDGSPITGFSPLHDDGTGGGPSLGQFKLFPTFCTDLTKCEPRESVRRVGRIEGSNKAHPGYFSLALQNNITTELTVSQHAVLYRFQFNSTNDASKAAIVFDLVNDLSHSYLGGQQTLEFLEDSNNTLRVTGHGQFQPSFGVGSYTVYMCLDIPNVVSAGTWRNRNISVVTSNTTVDAPSGSEAGAVVFLTPDEDKFALARMGVSWTSSEMACTFAETELPSITSSQFNATQWAATDRWDATLGAVQIDQEGADPAHVELFWSSLYRTYISPTNVSGDNPLWESSEPYWDSMYCIWDSYRTVHPLYAILQRDTQAEFVRSLVDMYRHLGYLPDCRMSLDKGFTQGGSNADSLLADSYVKGIRAGINWEDGLAAMRKDAEVTPPDWTVEGRGGIDNRKALGYVPQDDDTPGGIRGRSASRTLEYAFNDFGIALVANGLGDAETAAHYTDVSGDWHNLWNPDVSDSGYSGFIQPRFKNGSFSYVDPRHCSPVLGHFDCFLNDHGGEFYEAASWEYSYYVPHDMATVVGLMGGPETYIKRLDTLFSAGYHDIGDEPGFMHCFLYNYAGAPALTADRALKVLAANYSTAIGGLPGNDDSGAMGAFAVFTAFGFYPQAGTSVYLISTPLFKTMTFPSATPGKNATISTVNFDGAKTNRYIQSATLNGEPFTRNWFGHNELFGAGGVLEFTLGPEPSTWGTAPEDLPPSISTSKSLAPFS